MNSHCAEFELFPDFYNWAMQSGYELGMWLLRINGEKPFSPDNCEWYTPGERDNSEWINNWNKSVNRIRKYYGMPPLEGTEYGD
ncbi:hypothetical protein [Succinimonas sp.]|uniref:hypothetical protein n=1 Tax=Succinimonas sp. TaxID=1936151 RepID=UPI0038672B91